MRSGPDRLFAGRRISGPGLIATVLVVLAAFAVGIAAGWGTTLFARSLNSPTPSESPSVTPSPTPEPTIDVSLPPLEPVTREIDDADRKAGLRTLDFPLQGDGTYAPIPVPATATQTPDAGVVQYVRIDVEDGLQMIDGTLATFVMGALNDDRGWGKAGDTEYVQTEGAPDIRIVFASPYSAAALCPTPHEPAGLTPEASDSPSATPSPEEQLPGFQCASEGAIVVSIYDWIQGLDPYGDERTQARRFLLNHGLGHVIGLPDVTCKKGKADVMVDQRELSSKCTPNPWPFPKGN